MDRGKNSVKELERDGRRILNIFYKQTVRMGGKKIA
jgi:hypothetical protein